VFQLLSLTGQITVGVLLGLPMQPDDLCAIEDGEFAQIVRVAIDLCDMRDMRTPLVQRDR
jgi:hypothetical protein